MCSSGDSLEWAELNEGIYWWELSDREIRILREAQWIIDHKSTIRATAEEFAVSKSTIFKDMRKALSKLSMALYDQVSTILVSHRKW